MPQSDEPIGRVLQATYRLERKIRKGSMGTVYAASHTRLPRRFAVKYLAHEVARRADALARFRREAEVASRIGHPNIVEVVDINSDDEGRPYIVMELLEGEDLETHLRGRGRLAPDQVLQILQPVASALDAAHAAGVIHRDLKPSNIFLARVAGGALQVKIVDFGISKVLAAQNALTTGDAILGTPYYMAPEQAEGELEAIRAQTDVYALGAILFELLSGQTAITGDSTLRVLYQIVHGPAPSLAKLRPELPAAICETVDRALRKRPEDRHASAGKLADAFAAAVLGSAETRVQAVRPPASSDPEEARQTILRPRLAIPEATPVPAIPRAGSRLWLAAVGGGAWGRCPCGVPGPARRRAFRPPERRRPRPEKAGPRATGPTALCRTA
jgi:serine/threonine-protein kinase